VYILSLFCCLVVSCNSAIIDWLENSVRTDLLRVKSYVTLYTSSPNIFMSVRTACSGLSANDGPRVKFRPADVDSAILTAILAQVCGRGG